jgi:putative transposase
VAEKWRGKGHEKAAEHIEEYLSCLAFPESHRKRIRTTSWPGDAQPGDKARTRVLRIFPNREACLRLVTALAAEQSEAWVRGRRYLDIGELEERRPRKEEQGEKGRGS